MGANSENVTKNRINHIILIGGNMVDFILNLLLWTCALYGLIEIIKNIYYIFSCTNLKTDGIYLIVACKNQENNIEAYMRSVFFRLVYGKEEYIKELMVADLNSEDDTLDILKKLQTEYKYMKIINWKKCKEIIDNVEEVNK